MANDFVYNGSVSAPSAAANVVQGAAMTAGRYSVVVQVHLEGSGTPAAADLDNMALYSDSTQIAVLAVPETKSVLFSTPEIVVEVAAAKKLSVQAVGNATGSVVYSATIRARPLAQFP
jgi:hypothetical protein